MTTVAPPRTIADVTVTEFHDKDGQLIDRRILLVKDCGHVHNLSIRLDAPLPQIGDVTEFPCLSCAMQGVGR